MPSDIASLNAWLAVNPRPGEPVERCGFIMADDSVVEVANISTKPAVSFDMAGADILRFSDDAKATWHTHVDAPSNFSRADWYSFLNFSNLVHYIVGSDGVACYRVDRGTVIDA